PWQGGQRGGAGKVAWLDDAANFDPALTLDQPGFYGVPSFYRGLTFFNEKSEMQNELAESIDVSSDAKTFRFKIKKGVTFHHGRELTAEDVRYTIERVLDPKTKSWGSAMLAQVSGASSFSKGKASQISGLKTPSKYVLEVHLDEPNVTVPGLLGVQ